MSRIPVSRKDRVRSETKKRRVADSNLQSNTLSPTDVNAIIAQYLIDNPVGGSVGKIVAFDSGQLAAGASGAVLTDTAGTGQYFKLTYLTANNLEAGITLTVDGVDIFSNENLAAKTIACPATTSNFAISSSFGTTSSSSNNARILQNVYCTSFTLTKLVGSTSSYIDYAYETLEAL